MKDYIWHETTSYFASNEFFFLLEYHVLRHLHMQEKQSVH